MDKYLICFYTKTHDKKKVGLLAMMSGVKEPFFRLLFHELPQFDIKKEGKGNKKPFEEYTLSKLQHDNDE